jgi:hypothetical protein
LCGAKLQQADAAAKLHHCSNIEEVMLHGFTQLKL